MSYAIVNVPGVVRLTPNAVVIEEMVGMHDLATITIDTATEGTDLLKGALTKPVEVIIIDGGMAKVMVGYLDTYIRGSDAGQATDTFFVLGATSAMRNGASKTWRDAKPFDVAKQVVNKYSFGLEMDTYTYSLPSFVQGTESDWETLRKLAGEMGYFLVPAGTTVRMIHPNQEIRRQVRNVLPLFITPAANGISTNVSEFSIVDTKSPIGFENTEFSGIDKYGNFFSVTADTGASVTRKSNVLVASASEAMQAAERLKNRSFLQRRASMVIAGGANLYCGGCVSVQESAQRLTWLISEIKHAWHQDSNIGTYTASMSLVRPDTDSDLPAPYRDVTERPRNVASGGTWRAEHQWAVEL